MTGSEALALFFRGVSVMKARPGPMRCPGCNSTEDTRSERHTPACSFQAAVLELARTDACFDALFEAEAEPSRIFEAWGGAVWPLQ